MKTVFLFVLTVIMISCSPSPVSEREELLTSIHWRMDSQSVLNIKEASERKETYQFHKDGTYILQAHDTRINGKWSWTGNDEIYLQEDEIVISGKAYKYDSPNNRYIRVVEISDKVLRTQERHEGDTWDSGFTKEIKYSPEV